MYLKVLLPHISHQATIYAGDKALSTKWLWYIWIIFSVSMFLLQVSTIDILPSMMQDEAQITDYGRLALDPFSSWSVTWWVAGEKPLFLWSYLGPVFAEVGYNLGGASGVGPRIMALLGGLTAAIAALGWLLERKVPATIAGLLALAFLLDPLFTLSQRMARSDSWVMTFCLASCWLLARSSSKTGSSKVSLLMISGTLAATASFVWPSAVFLYPLVCMELFRSIYDEQDVKRSLNGAIRYTLYFLLGGLLMSFILIIPIWQQLPMIGDMKNMVSLNVNATRTPLERLLYLFNYHPWAKLVKAFAKTLSPFLPLMALWAIVFRREKMVVVVFMLTLSIILLTLVYEFRILYLLPYFLLMSGPLFRQISLKPLTPVIRRISLVLLGIAVFWAIGISIFLRTALAFNDQSVHDRSLINVAATSAIGRGNYKVFLAFTYEFYFTGRALGWELYTPSIQFTYDDAGNWIRKDDFQPKDKFMKLMSRMDYAIFPEGSLNDATGDQLKKSGLTYRGNIYIGDETGREGTEAQSDRMSNIILWFLRGADTYGPYRLYARPKTKPRAIQATYRGENVTK